MPDLNRVYDGFTALPGGMNGGIAPSLIPTDQCAASSNLTFRDGFAKTRPPYSNLILAFANDTTEAHFTGKFQGAVFYESEFGEDGFIVARDGRLFRIQIGLQNVVSEITPQISIVTTAAFVVPAAAANVTVNVTSETPFSMGDTVYIDSGQYTVASRFTDQLLLTYVGSAANATAAAGSAVLDSTHAQVIEYQTNPNDYDLIYMFQAENYIIALAGQHSPVIYDGSSARLAGIGEIPPGVLGTYVWGRIWIVRPDRRTFMAGDLVYGPSGTAANGFRDSILKVTESTFLNEGGDFAVPKNAGPITSMSALATQDTSLGVGNLLVGTTNMIFSVNTPVDRTTWKNLSFPIQTVSVLEYGPLGPRSTITVNGDLWYRSIDGFRSFIVASRFINQWGNTPMSRELTPVLNYDTEDLLFFGSSILFDNKFISTVSPVRSATGVQHLGMAVINFDLLSNMRQKTPPAWEGVYSGLNILQLVKGRFDNEERAVAFVLNGSDIELWELKKTGYYDTFYSVDNDQTSITRVAVQSFMETRSYPFGDGSQLKTLSTAEVFLDELVDTVSVTIKFRPDQDPNYTTWSTFNLCANKSQCNVAAPTGSTCSVWKENATQYAARIMIPRPPETCNSISGMPVCWGYEFQFRIEVTGHARIRKFKPHAHTKPDEQDGKCPGTPTCSTVQTCGTNWFNFDSHGT